MSYVGRFAPSPTGPLHAGSLVAALASWLDARAHGGQWLVRIEDVDQPRCPSGADQHILAQLAACALHPDAPPLYQSLRGAAYQRALDQLITAGAAYPCGCTRSEIAALQTSPRHGELIYPGTCRSGLHGRPARAWRLRIDTAAPVHWSDRRLGPQQQNVSLAVGDFVLRRADGLWAYQLAVVVDDAEQGITHVVRGADLADNTPRQRLLHEALGLASPHYLHTPLVLGTDGEKLSKQNGAQALDLKDPGAALQRAASALGLPIAHGTVAERLASWAKAWPWRDGCHTECSVL